MYVNESLLVRSCCFRIMESYIILGSCLLKSRWRWLVSNQQMGLLPSCLLQCCLLYLVLFVWLCFIGVYTQYPFLDTAWFLVTQAETRRHIPFRPHSLQRTVWAGHVWQRGRMGFCGAFYNFIKLLLRPGPARKRLTRGRGPAWGNSSSSNSLRVYGSYRKGRNPPRTIQIHLSRWRRLDWDETILFWSISFLFREAHSKKARKWGTISNRYSSLIVVPLEMLWSCYDSWFTRHSCISSRKNSYWPTFRRICFSIGW